MCWVHVRRIVGEMLHDLSYSCGGLLGGLLEDC